MSKADFVEYFNIIPRYSPVLTEENTGKFYESRYLYRDSKSNPT